MSLERTEALAEKVLAAEALLARRTILKERSVASSNVAAERVRLGHEFALIQIKVSLAGLSGEQAKTALITVFDKTHVSINEEAVLAAVKIADLYLRVEFEIAELFIQSKAKLVDKANEDVETAKQKAMILGDSNIVIALEEIQRMIMRTEEVSNSAILSFANGDIKGYFAKEALYRKQSTKEVVAIDWFLKTARDIQIEKAADRVRNSTFIFIIIVVVSIGGALGMAFIFSRSVTEPLGKLIKGTVVIGEGEFDHKIELKAKDEIGELADAFNKMTTGLREITAERDKTQAQLIQADKFSTIGQLGSGVAHELNSPLDGLLTMLRIRKKRVIDDPGEYKKLSIMVDAAEQMAKIIRDFGSFSREATGDFTNIDISDVIESTLSFSDFHLMKHDIKTIKEYDDNLLAIRGEKGQLQQVVLNIITNASDAMPQGGELVIRTRNSESGDKVIIEFVDTGTGIKEGDLPKLFDPFFTTKERGKGIGLGLSISYGIVKSHSGEILAESLSGECLPYDGQEMGNPPKELAGNGTKITLSFPALKTEEE